MVFSLNIFISINLQENICTHCYTKINRIGTEAYCLYSSSPRCNKFVHFMVAFLSLQYKIILRRFIVIKQYLEKKGNITFKVHAKGRVELICIL